MTTRPDIPESLILKFLNEKYGILGSLIPLPSERDQNFHVKASAEYVCKISKSDEELEFINFQNEAMLHLEKKQQQGIPRLVDSQSRDHTSRIKHGDLEYYVRIFTYVPGKVLAKVNPHDRRLFNSFGRFLGELSNNLKDFSYPNPTVNFYWSLKEGQLIIEQYRHYISEPQQIAILEFYDELLKKSLYPYWNQLSECIVHNDANDYNVLVNRHKEIGLIDFGDMVHSFSISELVIGLTYILLDKKDPIYVIQQMTSGYASIAQLNDLEMKLLFPLICLRLCQSVSISAYQSSLEPENEYLVISQQAAWKALVDFQSIHPNFVYYCIRDVFGLSPHPRTPRLITLLSQKVFKPIVEMQDDLFFIEQGVDSPELTYKSVEELNPTARYIYELSRENPDKMLIGRYDEIRLVYLHPDFESPSDDLIKYRNIHLGLDLFTIPQSSVYAPFDGTISAIGKHIGQNDWGTIVFIQHHVEDLTFYSLYGHLASESIGHLQIGGSIKAGDQIGRIGETHENGGWPPHVHFQIVMDLLNYSDNFPGIARFDQRNVFLSLSPDPKLMTGIDSRKADEVDLYVKRQKYISPALSLSYSDPLTIVRGYMQYLFDINGNRFLDAVNNVPHVGHSHPKIVKALTRQAGILNTNTRYLHPSILHYAEELLSRFPDALEVCFFVNSGSEANELALRLAKTYTQNQDVFVLDHAYHGNTSGLISISPYKFNGAGGSGKPEFTHVISLPDPFRPKYDSMDGYITELQDSLNALADRKPAAFIVESISGVGGQIFLASGFLPQAFEEVRKYGGLCIADEVQIGFGRIGSHFWGYEYYGVVPDIVTLGKPIGNGHPLAAVITTRAIAEKFANGMEYFNTFGGNPVSCEVGLAVLQVLKEQNLQQQANQVGTKLISAFKIMQKKYPILSDVRGEGLFLGIELTLDESKTPAAVQASYIVNRMKEKGVLLSVDGPFHNVIKMKPPMCFTELDAEYLIHALDEVLNEDEAQIF